MIFHEKFVRKSSVLSRFETHPGLFLFTPPAPPGDKRGQNVNEKKKKIWNSAMSRNKTREIKMLAQWLPFDSGAQDVA